MILNKIFVEKLKSCFLCTNEPIQILSSISLLLLQKNEIVIQNKNNLGLIDQLYNSIYNTKLDDNILINRMFKIFTELNILLYKSGVRSKISFEKSQNNSGKKTRLLKLKDIEKIFVEYFLHLPIAYKNYSFLNQKKKGIIEISHELKFSFLIVDFFGIMKADRGIRNYICDLNQIDFQISKIAFHVFRKLKNLKNTLLIDNSFNDKTIISYIFKDKLIKNENLSRFINCLEICQTSVKYWFTSLGLNLEFFFLWMTNVYNYKINIDKILCNVSFLKLDREIDLNVDENILQYKSQYIPMLKLKNFGKLISYSSEILNFISFLKYGDMISKIFDNSLKFRKHLSELPNINLSTDFIWSELELSIFDKVGFFYFREILIGIIELKLHLMKLKKSKIPLGFEKKIIFSMGLIVCKNYSKKIFYFVIKKIRHRDFTVFLKTGNFMIFKNLSCLYLIISLIPTKFLEKVSEDQLKKYFKVFLLKIIDNFILSSNCNYFKQDLSPKNLIQKNCCELKTRFLISFLLSSSITHLNYLEVFYTDFLHELVRLLKKVSNKSILNREKDFILKFLPLIFGVLFMGTRLDLSLLSFKMYLPGNRVLKQICNRMIEYCSFLSSNKKELVEVAIKEIRLFESIKIKKLERIFFIKERCKKNKIEPIFLSIYDLNIEKELDRSFIYYKTNIEGSIIGLCILSFGNDFMSKLIYRIQSFFLSSDSIEYSSFAILAVSFLFISNNECPAIDFLTKLSVNNEFIVAKNSIFSLGLVGAGTNNTRIKNALKGIVNFYDLKLEKNFSKKRIINEEDDFQLFRKLKSIVFLIRLSQGMVNSFFHDLLQKHIHTAKLNTSTINLLLFALFSFMISNFIGNESVFTCFFLFINLFRSKLICFYDANHRIFTLKIKKLLITNLNQIYLITPCFSNF